MIRGAGLDVSKGRTPDDAGELKRITQGDLGGLGELYDRHARSLYAFVRAAAPEEDAEDIVHNTFLRLLAVAGSYRGTGDARAWLFGIAARVMRERRRSFARFARAVGRFAAEPQPSSEPPPADGMDIERGLRRLTESKRIVLVLAEVEGFTCPEIAAILEVPIGTVWTRLHHARREIRRFGGGDS